MRDNVGGHAMKKSKKLRSLNEISAAEAVKLFDSAVHFEPGPFGEEVVVGKFPDNVAAREFLEGLSLYQELIRGVDSDFPDEEFDAPVGPIPEIPADAKNRLPPKERRVFDLVMEGLSNKEIASRCNISSATVKSQKANIFRRFGVGSARELMALAAKSSVSNE